MITDTYKKLNEQLHEDDINYGTSSIRWLDDIRRMITRFRVTSLLDYGCGKGLLRRGLYGLDIYIHNYDPCVPEFSHAARRSELVVCTDVMEHVEAGCIDAVLADLHRLTEANIFFVISTVPGRKFLRDRSNTHRSVHDADWWVLKISGLFDIFETSIMSKIDSRNNITSCVSILAKPINY